MIPKMPEGCECSFGMLMVMMINNPHHHHHHHQHHYDEGSGRACAGDAERVGHVHEIHDDDDDDLGDDGAAADCTGGGDDDDVDDDENVVAGHGGHGDGVHEDRGEKDLYN